ncbi:type III pantothenate kinase [Desulfitispora alkaliphila]|uniref:type III pantothenate kinase n=1 Tax=Desulfitispora alkaliphila TaxID=622674 RepID=UPI003D1B9DE1
MLLAFDVGNTNIVIGIYGDDNQLKVNWRISTERQKTADEYGMLLKQLFDFNQIELTDISDVIISSVVPPLITALSEMCESYFGFQPVLVGPGVKTGIAIKYDNPREVGADRIVNAVAAYKKYGGPCVVVDFGTATTFCAVSEKGDYLGGAIAPGINISTEALFQKAAKLPRIQLVKPETIIGKNTVVSMQAGIVYGYISQVDGIVKRMRQELGGDAIAIATGGLASFIGEESEAIDYIDEMLTVDGLRIIYEMNRNRS